MKRVVIKLLVSIVFMLFFIIPTFASSTTYKLDELGLEVSIPSSYDVITRDTPLSSPIFKELGIYGKELMEQFETSSIYLNAIPKDISNEEIVVTMAPNIINNFSALSDTSLKILASSLTGPFEEMNFDISEYDIYEHSQAKFIRLNHEDTVNSVSILQYYTIYNKKAINFTMRSYSGEITSTQEQTIRSIVDTIKFDTPPAEPPADFETEAFIYTDTKTNIKFTVPANWYEKELLEERDTIDVKFMSSKEEAMTIMYCSVDVWESLTDEEKAGGTRSDIGNDVFTSDDIAEFYGIDKSKISTVKYNGVEYFQFTVKQTTELYGIEVAAEITFAVRFDNGWLYIFNFGGTTDNKYFCDFKELMNTVQYPDTKKSEYSVSSYYELFRQGPKVYIPVIIISLLITMTAYAIFPLIFASVRRKAVTRKKYNLLCFGINLLVMFFFIALNGKSSGSPYILWTCVFSSIGLTILKKRGVLKVTRKKSEGEGFPGTETESHSDECKIKFCRKCGNELLEDSRFCDRCGTEIIKE